MRLKSIVGIFELVTVLLIAHSSAIAQFGGGVVVCTNCSTEPTQLGIQTLHNLEYAKQLLQYAVQVQQLADAVTNTAHGRSASLTNISADLSQLANVVQGGQSLAYSLGNQDVLFRQTYPGYQTQGPGRGLPPGAGTYASKYAAWAETSLATTQGILRGTGVQGRLLATEQGVLGVLRSLSASNLLNRNDGINLGSQLAGEQVAQLQKLRELQLEDMTSKAAYQGYVIQRQAANEAASAWFFSSGPARGDGRLFQPGLH
jgi:P-type conjugative transfer protein TrbJ